MITNLTDTTIVVQRTSGQFYIYEASNSLKFDQVIVDHELEDGCPFIIKTCRNAFIKPTPPPEDGLILVKSEYYGNDNYGNENFYLRANKDDVIRALHGSYARYVYVNGKELSEEEMEQRIVDIPEEHYIVTEDFAKTYREENRSNKHIIFYTPDLTTQFEYIAPVNPIGKIIAVRRLICI